MKNTIGGQHDARTTNRIQYRLCNWPDFRVCYMNCINCTYYTYIEYEGHTFTDKGEYGKWEEAIKRKEKCSNTMIIGLFGDIDCKKMTYCPKFTLDTMTVEEKMQ